MNAVLHPMHEAAHKVPPVTRRCTARVRRPMGLLEDAHLLRLEHGLAA